MQAVVYQLIGKLAHLVFELMWNLLASWGCVKLMQGRVDGNPALLLLLVLLVANYIRFICAVQRIYVI